MSTIQLRSSNGEDRSFIEDCLKQLFGDDLQADSSGFQENLQCELKYPYRIIEVKEATTGVYHRVGILMAGPVTSLGSDQHPYEIKWPCYWIHRLGILPKQSIVVVLQSIRLIKREAEELNLPLAAFVDGRKTKLQNRWGNRGLTHKIKGVVPFQVLMTSEAVPKSNITRYPPRSPIQSNENL